MENKLSYTHLIYVRKYSILDNNYKLYAYGVNTKDIHHTIGEIVCRTLEDIKRIDYVECSQSSLDYLKEQDIKIYDFYDKYELEQTPTEEEIIKEWDEVGYEWIDNGKRIFITSKETFDGYRQITIAVIYKEHKKYSSSYLLDMKLHQLLTKTFKMLGWE